MRRTVACLAFMAALASAAAAQAQPAAVVHFTIDAQQNPQPISRFIYGVNSPIEGGYADCTFSRAGGNRWTAYNWTNNASNAGSDWQFQNDGLLSSSDSPGAALLPTIRNAAAHNAALLITVPMAGYVAADKKGDGDVRQSGADYLKTRFRPSLPAKGSAFSLTPDPKAPAVYADEFVNWVRTQCPKAETDPHQPLFLALDNEPDLWAGTHAEVHPEPPTYEELIKRSVDYAAALKKAAPKALVFGPVNYGWMGFVRLQDAPDAKGRDFQEVYLAELAAAEKSAGHRLLDALDVHWYPEARGGGVRISEPGTAPATVAARVQAPRSLWDATYTEDSWITKDVLHGPINLLPRLREKIAKHYPGTRLAMTEYNYGGGDHISGGIAEADVLGILGREGVYAAALWPMAKNESYLAAGFRMFRNFDGRGAAFGDTSIAAATDNLVDTSIYASLDSTNPKRLVLVAINKTDRPLTAQIRLAHAKPFTKAEAYQLTSSGPDPKPAPAIPLPTPAAFDYPMPPMSVSTICLTGP
jgi:hypothetical protein